MSSSYSSNKTGKRLLSCPSCGWENISGADSCPFCHSSLLVEVTYENIYQWYPEESDYGLDLFRGMMLVLPDESDKQMNLVAPIIVAFFAIVCVVTCVFMASVSNDVEISEIMLVCLFVIVCCIVLPFVIPAIVSGASIRKRISKCMASDPMYGIVRTVDRNSDDRLKMLYVRVIYPRDAMLAINISNSVRTYDKGTCIKIYSDGRKWYMTGPVDQNDLAIFNA